MGFESSKNIKRYELKSLLIKGLFLISRPLNSFLAGFAIVIGAIAAISHPLTESQLIGIILGYFTTSLIAIGGYAINDVFDIEIDKINMPHRPIPSEYITLNQAKAYAIILFVTGVILALIINITAFLIAFVAGLLLYLYAAFFKRSGLLGNLLIALLVAVPFIYGGYLTESFETTIYPALFAFLLNFGREVIKDIEDVHGDRIQNVQSVAIRYGVKIARNLGCIILICLICMCPIPVLLGYYKTPIFIILLIIIEIALITVLYLLFNRTENEIIENSTRVKRILKSCMSLGVLAFVSEGLIKLFLLSS